MTFRLYLLSFFAVAGLLLHAQNISNKKCLAGDCYNALSTMTYSENGENLKYVGQFKNGLFHGHGVIYDLNRSEKTIDIPKMVARFKDGEIYKRSLEAIPQYYGYMDPYFSYRTTEESFYTEEHLAVNSYNTTMRFSNGEKSTKQFFLVYDFSDKQRLIIDKPFVSAFGTCIKGDCENGNGTLRLEGIGDFESSFPFSKGVAQVAGYLTLKSGEVLQVWIDNGIPTLFITRKLPPNISRLDAAKRRFWKLPEYSCLEGDCLNGYGIVLYGSADRFADDELNKNNMVGYFEGQFEKGGTKKGVLKTFDGRIVKGDFSAVNLHGSYTVQEKDGKTSTYHFLNNQRVTADGKPYKETYSNHDYKPTTKPVSTSTKTQTTEPAKTWTPYQMQPIDLHNTGSKTCPVCGGTGKEIIVDKYVDNTTTTYTEDDSHYYKQTKTETSPYYKKVKCYKCKGTGTVNP